MTTTAKISTPVAKPPLYRVMLRRVALTLLAMAMILIPSILLFAITKQPSATYASMGTIIGVVAVLAGGQRIGVITAMVVALLAPISIVAGLSPVTGAALMAVMTLTVGRLSIFGLHRAVVLVPIFLAWPMLAPVPWLPTADVDRITDLMTKSGLSLAQAVDQAQSAGGSSSSGSASTTASTVTNALIHQRFDSTYLAWVALFFFVGAIVPVILLPLLLRGRHMPKLTPHRRSEAVPYTVVITVLTAAATFYFLDHPKQAAGAFLIATILVLTQIGNDVAWRITIERVLGTLVGVAVLIGVTSVVGRASYDVVMGVPMPMTYYAIGLVFGAAAVIAKFSPRQWIYYILITPTAALLNAFTTSQANDFGEQRLVDNLVGAGLVIAAALLTLIAGRYMDKHVVFGTPADVADASPA